MRGKIDRVHGSHNRIAGDPGEWRIYGPKACQLANARDVLQRHILVRVALKAAAQQPLGLTELAQAGRHPCGLIQRADVFVPLGPKRFGQDEKLFQGRLETPGFLIGQREVEAPRPGQGRTLDDGFHRCGRLRVTSQAPERHAPAVPGADLCRLRGDDRLITGKRFVVAGKGAQRLGAPKIQFALVEVGRTHLRRLGDALSGERQSEENQSVRRLGGEREATLVKLSRAGEVAGAMPLARLPQDLSC